MRQKKIERGQNYYYYLWILLSDGTVLKAYLGNGYLFQLLGGFPLPEIVAQLPADDPSRGFNNLVGDDLYVLGPTVRVSRDDGATWQLDTLGLNGASPRDIGLDSLQNVYLATSNGLFIQTHTGTTWSPDTSMKKPLSSVFIDRKNAALYVAAQQSNWTNWIYRSTDLGITWQIDTSGIGAQFGLTFADDVYGNIYARTWSNLYKSASGTQPWTKIDQNLISKSASGYVFINGIAGDSTLVVATTIGLYTSSDQGTMWSDANSGIRAENAYGLAKLPSGRIVTETDLGIYFRDPSATSWTKSLPVSGYQVYYLYPIGIQRDKNAVLYTSNSIDIVKSTDNGTTWTKDLPGFQGSGSNGVSLPFQPGLLFVDENGTQHYCPPSYVGTSTFTSNIFIKSSGNWVADQTGLTFSSTDRFFGYASDQLGNLFLFRASSSNPQVTRRAISGGSWSADTSGLNGKGLISMARDRSGNMVGGGSGGGVFRRVGGVWGPLPSPGNIATNDVSYLSVDSTGAIFAGLQVPGLYIGRGVYFTTDNGGHWTYAGLDSVLIRGLASYGDTTFALTRGRGVAILRSSSYAFAQLTSSSLVFDSTSIGQFRDKSVSLRNTGTDSLRITSVTSSNSVFVPQLTSATIGSQQSFNLPVRFTPNAVSAFKGTIVIVSNSASSPDTVRVGGIGVAASAPGIPILATPTNGATNQPLNLTLRWRRAQGASTYRIQVATDSGFVSLVVNDSTVADTSKQMSSLTANTKYYWRVSAKNTGGTSPYSSTGNFTTGTQTSVNTGDEIPKLYSLAQNYPNPFNPTSVIRYGLPERSRVTLRVFDLLGRLVTTLVDKEQEAHYYEVPWNATMASSGLYIYRISAISTVDARKAFVQVKKMILLK